MPYVNLFISRGEDGDELKPAKKSGRAKKVGKTEHYMDDEDEDSAADGNDTALPPLQPKATTTTSQVPSSAPAGVPAAFMQVPTPTQSFVTSFNPLAPESAAAKASNSAQAQVSTASSVVNNAPPKRTTDDEDIDYDAM